MQKRIRQQAENLLRMQHSYQTDDTVFIDTEMIRKVKRKAIQMKGKLSLRFAGRIYQQCMEELGIWEVEEG